MLASGEKMRNTWTWEGGKAGNLKKNEIQIENDENRITWLHNIHR